MSAALSRRSTLRGSAAASLGLALPTVAVAGKSPSSADAMSTRALPGSVDPFTTYHARILAIQNLVENAPSEEAADRAMDAWGDVDREALAGRPTTFAGAAGALAYARREFVQFEMQDREETDNGCHRLILHLIDGAMDVLRQAAAGGARG